MVCLDHHWLHGAGTGMVVDEVGENLICDFYKFYMNMIYISLFKFSSFEKAGLSLRNNGSLSQSRIHHTLRNTVS